MPPTEGLTDSKAAIPLYQQVIDIIKNEINSGAYKAGARIPNEFELAESYKVTPSSSSSTTFAAAAGAGCSAFFLLRKMPCCRLQSS